MFPSKIRVALLIAVMAIVTGQITFAQEAKNDPSVERMKKDIFFLASDLCEGRGVGTQGLDLAAEYIAAQFKKAGLKPGGVNGTYFQPFTWALGAKVEGDSSCVITGPEGIVKVLKQGVDFQIVGTSAPGRVNAPLAFVGYGVTARGIDYDDYKGIDAKGKAVVALRRVPRWNDNEKPFDGANKSELATLDIKHHRGEQHQAAAVILVNDATELPKDGLVSLGVTGGINTMSTPYIHIKRSVVDDMLKSATGKSLAETEKAIDADLKPRSADLSGWSVSLDVKIKRTKEYPVRNVIGYIDGAGPLANEIVVVGAHYDHVGYGLLGGSLLGPAGKGKLHFGADDNGSGTTSVMELARRFAARREAEVLEKKEVSRRKVVFMTFTAEETGLIGSRHYTRVPLFPLKDTVAMFNLDMVGRVKDNVEDGAKPKLLVLGIDSGKGFNDLINKYNNGFDIKKDGSVFGASDHYSFYTQKVPVLFFFTGTHPEYHRPTDVPEKINLAGMSRVAGFAEGIINHWRTDPERPEYMQIKNPFGGGGPSSGGVRIGFLPDMEFGGKGVLVGGVSAGGPADLAGMKKGDIIVELAGKSVANLTGYQVIRETLKTGVSIEIRVLRDGKQLTLKVTPK